MSMGMNGLARSSSSLVSSFTIACVSENEYNKDNEAHTSQHSTAQKNVRMMVMLMKRDELTRGYALEWHPHTHTHSGQYGQ